MSPSLTQFRHALLVGAAAFAAAASAVAQEPAAAETPTLHVYANLLQIPVLVTDRYNAPVPNLDTSRLRIHLLDGPTITPSRVRLEGDDPITLAILIDYEQNFDLIDALPEALAALTKKDLRPTDRIAIYATDGCHLRRFSTLELVSEALLRDRMAAALKYPPVHGGQDCSGPRRLWDAMAWTATSLASESGRRVLLAITPGEDIGSVFSYAQLAARATDVGVAMFAITPVSAFDAPMIPVRTSSGVISAPVSSPAGYLKTVTDGSGGMILKSSRQAMTATLQHFVQLVRGRYIVEFARPANMSAGRHGFQVVLGTDMYIVHAGGTSMPAADPSTASPNVEHGVLQHDPSRAPSPGTVP